VWAESNLKGSSDERLCDVSKTPRFSPSARTRPELGVVHGLLTTMRRTRIGDAISATRFFLLRLLNQFRNRFIVVRSLRAYAC